MKIFTLALIFALTVAAQQNRPRVFITPMEGHLDGFIAAEIIKQHLPVVVVTELADADMVLTGTSLRHDEHLLPFVGAWWWSSAIVKDRNEGNIRLVDLKAKTMVWAGEAGDRSLFFDNWRRGGSRKVADRLVRRLAQDVSFDSVAPAAPNGYKLAAPKP